MEVWKFLVVSVACIHISSTHGREVSKSVYCVAYIKHLLMLLLNRNCDSDFSGSFFFFFFQMTESELICLEETSLCFLSYQFLDTEDQVRLHKNSMEC